MMAMLTGKGTCMEDEVAVDVMPETRREATSLSLSACRASSETPGRGVPAPEIPHPLPRPVSEDEG